jgi:hypothetical protein
VVVSRAIPMADTVAAHGCGVVVEAVTPAGVHGAVQTLRRDYARLCRAAETVGRRDFSAEAALAAVDAIYARAIGATR